jgi:glycosyltransferase involved in cell wall biosynthesis
MVAPWHRNDAIDGIPVHAVPFPAHRSARMTRTVWEVYRAGLAQHADIYHLHDPELLPIGLLLKIRGRDVIYDAHEDVPRDIMLKTYIPLIPRWLIAQAARVVEKGMAALLDGVVVAGDHMVVGFAAARRVAAVRNYASLDSFIDHPGPMKRCAGPVRLVYVGHVAPLRGVGKVIEALALLPGDLDVRLELYGDMDEDAADALSAAIAGSARVAYRGPVDHADVPRRLAEADIGIACLQPVRTYVEALPTKLFEYLAAGLPVIGSDFPNYREVLDYGPCGVCADPTDPRDIAAAIERLARDHELRWRLGRNARHASERYGWRSEGDRLVELYRDILRKGR